LFSMHPFYIVLVLGLLLLPTSCCSSSAPANDTLVAGRVFTVGDKLVSRNGKFALGFFQPAASTISKSSNNSWYLGIWFNKIPVFTTVWVANREEPITHPNINSTQLKITRDGNLVIVVKHANAGTESLVWSTHMINRTQTSNINTTTTSAAVLLNTGNLAVKVTDSPSSDLPLWQSFDYPADVVLPGAKLGWNKVTGLNRHIISKKSLIDLGLGSYSLGLDTTGLAILERRKNPAVVFWHWASSKTLSMSIIPVLKTILD
uniref:non-specific serine/threonine protein kinase n=1 Tax=Aegilops tauschii subsp. strangulata TaxID=200361 RepID=A0A452XD21_AEGTS